MSASRLPVRTAPASHIRRGGVRGTRAASGSPPSGAATSRATIQAEALDSGCRAKHEPLLLEAPEVARLLGIGRTKVYELLARRELPVLCIGRCVRVPKHQLQIWIASHTEMAGRR